MRRRSGRGTWLLFHLHQKSCRPLPLRPVKKVVQTNRLNRNDTQSGPVAVDTVPARQFQLTVNNCRMALLYISPIPFVARRHLAGADGCQAVTCPALVVGNALVFAGRLHWRSVSGLACGASTLVLPLAGLCLSTKPSQRYCGLLCSSWTAPFSGTTEPNQATLGFRYFHSLSPPILGPLSGSAGGGRNGFWPLIPSFPTPR